MHRAYFFAAVSLDIYFWREIEQLQSRISKISQISKLDGLEAHACVLSHFSHVQLCNPMDSSPQLLCPWDSPDKNNGMAFHELLQGIFPTQRSNPSLLHLILHRRQILYPWATGKAGLDVGCLFLKYWWFC